MRLKYKQGLYPIISKKSLAKEVYDVTILCPEIAHTAKAGQFVNVRADGFMLRRPISICSIDRERGTVRIVFEVRGDGTKAMSRLSEGGLIDIVAPLGGRPFKTDGVRSAVLVGGGIGTPPMLALAEIFGGDCTVISGFRSAAAVILQEDFVRTGAETILCTDDGTAGRKGFVTDALREVLEKKAPDTVCACGPDVMLRRVVEIAREKGVKCQVSLEERMGCGVGACLVCACRTIRGGEEYYAHVCKDGPVFPAEEIFPDK